MPLREFRSRVVEGGAAVTAPGQPEPFEAFHPRDDDGKIGAARGTFRFAGFPGIKAFGRPDVGKGWVVPGAGPAR
jgi:hypothetical protein